MLGENDTNHRLRIAIVGSGISGLTCAYLLSRRNDITVFEAGSHVGGHTNTVDVAGVDDPVAVDTGFIVFNDRTYPNFFRILNELHVAAQPTSMSFSVRHEHSGLEYNGSSLNRLFSQRLNLVRPAFYRLLIDILRFNKRSRSLLEKPNDSLTLGDYLTRESFSSALREQYIVPMGAALWSADPERMSDFPARYFVQFFENHGLLGFGHRPNWFVIKGGSREYVRKMTESFRDRIRVSTPVKSVRRHGDGVDVFTEDAEPERFDSVVLACHSDQALALLLDPSAEEREILGAIPYQPNVAVLHCDTALLPKCRRAWGSWNYLVPKKRRNRVAVTYYMNILQNLRADRHFCVTLNQSDGIAADRIIREIEYQHPVYTVAGLRAQRRRDIICGQRRTYFAGAYWGFGFHEDGVNSALHVCAKFGVTL